MNWYRKPLVMLQQLLTALMLVSTVTHSLAGQELEVSDERLEAALTAQSQNEQRLQSAIGIAKFEISVQRADEEEPTLITTAKVSVYYHRLGKDAPFDRARYHVRMDLDHNMVRVAYIDADSEKLKPKLVDAKPEKRVLIHDGNDLYVVRFSERHRPTGCAGDVYPLSEARNARTVLPWQDPARLWKDCLDLRLLTKNVGRNYILISSTNSPDGFVGKYPAGQPHAEFRVTSEQGNQVTSHRVYNPRQKAPVQSYDLTWEQQKGVWYVKSLTETWDNRGVEKERGTYRKSVISFESFKVNEPVEQALFAIDSIAIPVGTRFINRSPQAEERYLYFDGNQLSKTRIPVERNANIRR